MGSKCHNRVTSIDQVIWYYHMKTCLQKSRYAGQGQVITSYTHFHHSFWKDEMANRWLISIKECFYLEKYILKHKHAFWWVPSENHTHNSNLIKKMGWMNRKCYRSLKMVNKDIAKHGDIHCPICKKYKDLKCVKNKDGTPFEMAVPVSLMEWSCCFSYEF